MKYLIVILSIFNLSNQAYAKPLKVYILAGQSNMEGHAKVETFDYIGEDRATAPLLKDMRGRDGKPKVCDRVWISYFTGWESFGEGYGKLTTGYGARHDPTKDGAKIGPEFMFGITMEEKLGEPILIIKTAWGGKSLNTDFRPPSAGPYKLPTLTEQLWAKHPNGAHGIPKESDRAAWMKKKHEATGVYYRMMIKHIKYVLSDIKRIYPGYKKNQGYELSGFVWFQGWNDMCDSTTYPYGNKNNRYSEYSELLRHFIRDIRKELKTPELPFVIGVMGVGGMTDTRKDFRDAMAAPATLPEFKENVLAVETAPYWEEALGEIDNKRAKVRQMAWFLSSNHKDHPNKDSSMTKEQQQEYVKKFQQELISPEDEAMWKRGASNAGYHYLGCAKTMAQIGKAFAEALLKN
ncbi:MAG: hypothetical protein HQL32_13740 [Planctomycetes bacterium]|nr:hypothetical protein [Planctomycetota bacterium]